MLGEAIARALDDRGYATVPIFMDGDVDQILRQEPIDAAFIALHGGTLDLTSEPGVGTVVTLRFPAGGVTDETANAAT